MLSIITNGYVLPFISKPNLVRFPLIQSEYKALLKDQALTTCIQSLLSFRAQSKGWKMYNLSGFKASKRLKEVQHFSTHRKVQNGNSSVHQDLPDSRGMGIVDRPIGRLPSRPHPPKLKEIPKVLLKVTGVPVHLPSFRTSHNPPGLYNNCKGSEVNGPLQRTQASPIPGRLADQVPVSGGGPSEHSGSGRPNPVLGVDHKSGKIRTETYLPFSFVGYEHHLDSALVKPTQERWLKLQDLILHLKSKYVLTVRCLMSPIGLLASMEKMVPEGPLHMRPFQFHLKEHWRYHQSLDSLLPWTETISVHLDWWQNPTNVMRGADLHPKDHSIQFFTDASKEGWGTHLNQSSTKDLWSDGEKNLHNTIHNTRSPWHFEASRTSVITKLY